MRPPLAPSMKWGAGGAIVRAAPAGGLNSQIHAVGDGAEWIRLQTRQVFGRQGNFLGTSIMSASTGEWPPRRAEPVLRIGGTARSRLASSGAPWKKSLRPWPPIWNQRPAGGGGPRTPWASLSDQPHRLPGLSPGAPIGLAHWSGND